MPARKEQRGKPEERVKEGVRRMLRKRAPRVYWYMPIGGLYSRRGAPDFTVCVDGLALFIETKAPGKLGSLRPEQRTEMVNWAKAGAVAIAVDDPDAAAWVVDGMLARASWISGLHADLCSDFATPRFGALRVRRKVRNDGSVFFEARDIKPHRSALRDLKEGG